MFPTVKVTASGLEASQHYFVLMDIVLAEEFRYKYSGKEWVLAGKAEPQLPARLVPRNDLHQTPIKPCDGLGIIELYYRVLSIFTRLSQTLLPPRWSSHREPLDDARHLLPQGQAHQQHHGPE